MRFAPWLLALCLLPAGCGDDNTGGDQGMPGDANTMGDLTGADLSGTGGDLAGADLTGGPPDMVMTCGAIGQKCANGSGCCSGWCDPMTTLCIPPPNVCGSLGAACMGQTDCCSLNCTAGKCGAACKQNGTMCAAPSDCCSGNCANGSCAPVVMGGCGTLGQACNANGDCCSQNCQTGLCVSAGGNCSAVGDVCFKDSDCCSSLCTIPNGLTAGTCTYVNAGGGGNCQKDGEPCVGCTGCCSRTCAPSMTGGHFCTPAAGCRLIGDICHQDSDCCGGPGQPGTGGGSVTCNIIAGTNPPVGNCSNPNGCDPEGDVCGLSANNTCGNSRHDCCDCIPPKINCCKFDKAGVPRCYGGSTMMCPNGYDGTPGCCIMAGQQCTFNAECCNGAPCVPDNMGVLRCGTMCAMTGQACTADSDCCAGLPCIIPKGSLVGTCGNPPPPPPSDGGVPPDLAGVDLAGVDLAQPPVDMATCALVGQTCTVNIPCCNGASCENSTGANCGPNDANCSCFGIPGVPPPRGGK
jgi:hypothetical protein